MNADEFFADLLMLAHAGFSLFVVLGLMLVLVGMIFGWRWTRARGFRSVHLAATLFALLRVWMGWPCPFSAVENVFRSRITTPCPLGASFHEILHLCAFRGTDPHYFAGCTALFGMLALAAFVLNRDQGGRPQTAGTA